MADLQEQGTKDARLGGPRWNRTDFGRDRYHGSRHPQEAVVDACRHVTENHRYLTRTGPAVSFVLVSKTHTCSNMYTGKLYPVAGVCKTPLGQE
jgi:hypothetical protein